MRFNMKKRVAVFALISLSLLLVACSTGPTPPQKGTPEFYWQAATETFATADYLKTADHLDSIGRTENQFTNKAQLWRLVLTSGMTKAFMELGDNYEFGARINKANPTPFRKRVSNYRNMAAGLCLQFAETIRAFKQTHKEAEIALSFPFPTGSAGQVPGLNKLSNGIFLSDVEQEATQKRMLERCILIAVAKSAGAGEDPAKAQALFQAGEVKVPRAVFMTAMANVLYEQSQLFTGLKLDKPDQLKLFANEALDTLKGVPETKETKALTAKIQAALKKS
jgi:hypothetical protein